LNICERSRLSCEGGYCKDDRIGGQPLVSTDEDSQKSKKDADKKDENHTCLTRAQSQNK